MKNVFRIGILLLGIGVVSTVRASNPASIEYVDKTFSAIEQSYADLQQQINDLNNQMDHD